ncbi:MAG: hypothetical protein FWE33_02640 [Defluviitaleaceae bacterium]|nr:hypothetical protein [Defluviitaleaceae bacterium]
MLPYFVIVPVLMAIFLFIFTSVKSSRVVAIFFQLILVGFSGYLVYLTRSESILEFVGSTDNFLSIVLYAFDFNTILIGLTTVLFLVVIIYNFHQEQGKMFWLLLFIWQAVLLGILLSRDMFNIFVMMEVAGVVVTMLIMTKRKTRSIYDAIFYLLANVLAVQFFLLGMAYVYRLTGTLDLHLIAERLALVAQEDVTQLYLPYALVMTPIAFKCAMVPMSIWVPKAHGSPGAPTGVSAILSGMYIKCAVYLFITFQGVFAPVANHAFFVILGAVTAISGAIMAMSNHNAKAILAFHTVSQVGLIIFGVSLGMGDGYYSDYAMLGGLYHLVAHALFKSTLFLTAGIIKRSYGSLDAYVVRGVLKRMPIVGTAMGLAILGIMGAPFFIGSISKYYIAYGNDRFSLFFWLNIIIGLATIISFIKYGAMLFGKDPGIKGEHPKIDKPRLISVLIWSTLSLFGGLFGAQFINYSFESYVYRQSAGYGATANGSLLTTFTGDYMLGMAGYYEKAIWWILSVVVGYLLFRYVVKGNKVLKKLSYLDMGIKGIATCILVFFAALLISVGFM